MGFLMLSYNFFSLAGSSAKPNEDRIGAAHNTVWVIDGATGLGERTAYVAQEGDTDASWLAQNLDKFFCHAATAYGTNHIDLILAAHTALTEKFKQNAFAIPEAPYAFPSAALTLLTYDEERIKISSLGDGTTLLRNEEGKILKHGGDPVHLANDAAANEELRHMRQTLPAHEHGKMRELILPTLRKNRSTANQMGGFGYFTLAGPIAPSLIRNFECPRQSIQDAALFSDGFYAIVEDYQEMSDAELMKYLGQNKADEVATKIRSIEDADPIGEKFPRFKKSDDATCLYLKL